MPSGEDSKRWLISGQAQVMLGALDGDEIHAWLRWCVIPGYQQSFKMVLVSVMDLVPAGIG